MVFACRFFNEKYNELGKKMTDQVVISLVRDAFYYVFIIVGPGVADNRFDNFDIPSGNLNFGTNINFCAKIGSSFYCNHIDASIYDFTFKNIYNFNYEYDSNNVECLIQQPYLP